MADWQFFVPCERDEELFKGERKRLLRGIASTESKDKQGEEMVLSGMDFAPYLKSGRLNWDHKPGPQYVLGKPIEAKIVADAGKVKSGLKGPGFFHVVELYDSEPGRAAWDVLKNEKDDPSRNHGFSVEGAILETKRNRLTKTRVDDVALTPKPANTDTFAEFLAKSLTFEDNPALELQYIDDNKKGKKSPALVGFPEEIVLWGNCKHNCYNEKGRFRKGAQSALFHLVKCKGMDPDEAYAYILSLKKAGYFN